MQNVREYINVKLHTKAASAIRAASEHTFKSFSIVDENLVQTNHFQPTIIHNTPMAIGVTILELSKKIMFDAWYNKILAIPGCKFDLGMTDTDSFLFKVSNVENFNRGFESMMDYSNYDKNHVQFSDKNKAQLGFFKDELAGKLTCDEFVGLRSKCYSMNLSENATNKIIEKKVCKGIGRAAIKNRLMFKQYKECLFKKKNIRQDFHGIRSINHNVKTVRIRKKALNFSDNKRYIFDCGIHSVPFGSHIIEKSKNNCPRCEKTFDLV